MVITKIINQKVIGYSKDFTETYFEHVCKMSDGTIQTRYNTHIIQEDGFIHIGSMVEERPFIAVNQRD